ncbi:MAG: redox-regulated ATPase YchF [Candidatus Mcinerneyibacterium aminivorans]|uniref:Ribosome-binding ATPase YchF n=1 Tax=Candidatus Mcinerneyibacterium aminivorans TaxID=2703815 RepID=A0A5D0MD07_9BACT|nr:MAG: redox-regulated ATPase YchF [Candidatus Mcinerneyibacterium aminivorans]
MSLNCGIIGLPNVGKSTIFSALTSANAKASNYPFCTIDSNVGIVDVPDKRLDDIYNIFKPPEKIPVSIEFVDIAGLVEGASKGEGLGNKFLANIREVDALIHVVRCFENEDIAHMYKDLNPKRDIDVINLELVMSDLEVVQKRLESIEKLFKSQDQKVRDDAKKEKELLKKVESILLEGKPVRVLDLNIDEKMKLKNYNLLTLKKMLYLCNIDEDSINKKNSYVREVEKIAKQEGAEVLKLCGKLEQEIAFMDDVQDKKEFREMLGMEVSGLKKLIKKAYKLLGLETFFSKNENEVRAWEIRRGTTAPEAAGKIHSDMKKGFIKAKVYKYKDLMEYKKEEELKEHGLIRVEGKDYVVQDGDIIYFLFNN